MAAEPWHGDFDRSIELLVTAGMQEINAEVAVEILTSDLRDKDFGNNDDHWLCEALVAVASVLDFERLTKASTDYIDHALVEADCPALLARMIAVAATTTAAKALPAIEPITQIRLALLLFACAICPDPDRCTVGHEFSPPIVGELLATRS